MSQQQPAPASSESPPPRSDDDSVRYRPADTPSLTGSTAFSFKSDDETDLVSPEERALWEGREDERPAINLRAVLSENGRKGPVSGAQWPTHEIGDLLGEGGMAAVYLARRRDNGRLVALKILPARYADDAASRKRFEREAQFAQAIENRHVVKVWSAGRFGPLCYLEMEYVDGASLGDEIKRRRETAAKPFANDEVVDLAMQAADGLREAAKHQLVHRDIKPGNLMRTHAGVLKIADFGIVKVIGEEAMTMAGTALGTPSYMSPEQGRGDQVDARADIYSLGVVLYELLTLKQPFEEATADALIYQHHFVEPKLITELIPECDLGLQAVVFKCLQKFPDRRYADAAQLIRDLDLLKGGHPPEFAVFPKNRITTGADEALSRHGGGWRRWWKHALVGVASLILLVGLAVWWLLASRAQADSLRSRLSVLDTPQAIPVAASEDLDRLKNLVGAGDVQVSRWATKLTQAQQLRAALTALPHGDLTHAQVTEAAAAISAYQELCGTSEPLVSGWRTRLEKTAGDLRAARTMLGTLDRSETVPKYEIDRLTPVLAEAKRLSPADDADITRWTGLLAAASQRLADLRGRLSSIDTASVLVAAQQRSARDDLARWSVLMGAADEDGIRWTAKVQNAQDQITSVRQALNQLDQGQFASLAVAGSLDKEWTTFTSMADTDDVDLVRWTARREAAKEQRDLLAKRLNALHGKEPVSLTRLETMKIELVGYRDIVGDDKDARSWQGKLNDQLGRIDTARQVLASLLDKDQLSQEEQLLLRATQSDMTAQRALNKDEEERISQRLARDEAKLQLLGERLAVLNRQEDLNVESLRIPLEQFERLAAADDSRRVIWRRKFDEVVELRRRLAVLDERQPVAVQVERDLARLAQLVGPAPADVHRWSTKVVEMNAHKQALAALDVVGPVDEDASDRLERLRRLVGDTDADVQRWQGRLERLAILRGRLDALDHTYVLPPTASDDLREFRTLVGDGDSLVQTASERLRVLYGPNRPTWASAFGRDEFGLYADLTIWQQTQRFRYIPAGSFTIGSNTAEVGREADEAPISVRLTRSFWLADSECSQAFWAQIMLTNPAFEVQAGNPVERISWDDAQHFIVVIAKRTESKLPVRLPTEAEWEYAARAGADGRLPGHNAVGGDDLDRIAVHAGNAGGATRPVRARQPNRLGLYDLLGNVWEWCQDTYAPYPLVPAVDLLANQGRKRVVRGGSWGDPAAFLRVADRHEFAPNLRSAYVGIRIVIDVEWEK